MRYGLALLLAVCACYGPRLGSPGFYCHPDDEPSCPEGQTCVDGRCRNKGVVVQGRDMATGSRDMATPPRDMALTGKTGCNGYAQCLINCTDQICSDACDANVTSDGLMKFQMAIACGQNWCLNTAGDCDINAAGTMLVDAAGRPAGSCAACLDNALASLFNMPCPSPGSFNCNPSSCTTAYNTCKSSLP